MWYNRLIKIVKEMIGMNAITGSQAHTDYVIGCVFCQPLKQAFSHFCEKVFYVALESEVLV